MVATAKHRVQSGEAGRTRIVRWGRLAVALHEFAHKLDTIIAAPHLSCEIIIAGRTLLG